MLRVQDALLSLPSSSCNPSEINKLLRSYQPSNIASFSLDSHLALIDECFSAQSVEGIIERLSQRAEGEEESEFAKEQLQVLGKMVGIDAGIVIFNFAFLFKNTNLEIRKNHSFQSPTSLKVTFRQIRMGAKLGFDEVFLFIFELEIII